MGVHKYLKGAWKKKDTGEYRDLWKERLIDWRRQDSTVRIEHPTRLDAARARGDKAKLGYIVVRQRVMRGGRSHPHQKAGRRPKRASFRKDLNLNYRAVAEQRAQKQYPNCEVLNSYYVAEDGIHYWYEVILVDRAHPAIVADRGINWISTEKRRVFRGLTSAGKKSRGLRNKGKGAEKLRPSRTANRKRRLE